ncbi:hypothetical protein BV22DRAFT_1055685 [Leucogyrophana mollusca]|uniref:Uncharacterized protein n=1 Tax=Leucogyrophana mollusca TaxID=85980 RepID=A0ACB8BXS6_9AGAM|nr:hypothetical protein BV22DRAFT_1055685 [Leucogyrophana mollusca]
MSSWSASAYPPPRRSRSRSPPRGGHVPRGPYPDPGYPQDSYRGGWDTYDRERAWAEYERDRAAYEYSRRGRSRSPPPDETGRKRRRSMSPPHDRERYDPRPRYGDDYDAHSRGYGYRSPPRNQFVPPPFTSARRAPADPRTFDHPATLKQYAEWFRYFYPQQATEEDNADKAAEQEAGDGSKPRNGIRSLWEKYKKDFVANQLQTMFDHHRKSPWFAEKYDPASEFVALRRRVRKEGWKGRMNAFLDDLESGKFDPDLNEPEVEAPSPVKENSGGDIVPIDATGVSVPAEESKNGGEDDMQFNLDAEDDAGEHEATKAETNGKASYDNRRNNRGEEISVPPEGNQVMIRTIPPDIGRLKLEDACSKVPGYMYLALGDPLQKRNYYRAGWLRFRDDADMTAVMAELTDKKIEGFKLHVSHNLKPFVNRIRYVPEVASKPDRIEKDLVNAKLLASILEEEAAAVRKSLPAAEGDGPAANGDAKTEDAVMTDTHGDNEEDPEPKEVGSEAVERRIEKIMAELREQGLVIDEKAVEAKKAVISLDMYLAYLRAAFHTCYYCAVVTDHLEELQRKCLQHVRKPLSKSLLEEVRAAEAEKEKSKEDEKEKETIVSKTTENRDWKRNDERWLEWFDTKIALLINRSGVDPREYGGKNYDEELTKAVEPYIKQEDEGRFRCKTCQKLFKATAFVEKHVANKHPELVRQLEEVPYFNNFALDPHRIQPFSHPPPVTGNSQGPPPQAYGIQAPAVFPPPDYGRANAFYGSYPPSYAAPPPPPYPNSGQWDHYGYQYGAGAYPAPTQRRDEATTARRLSDRISGYATGYEQPTETTIPAGAGLPAKPVVTLDLGPSGLADTSRKGSRRGGGGGGGGPPPPPPSDAKEDPRATAGKKVSYHDMDQVAEGDIELTY